MTLNKMEEINKTETMCNLCLTRFLLTSEDRKHLNQKCHVHVRYMLCIYIKRGKPKKAPSLLLFNPNEAHKKRNFVKKVKLKKVLQSV